MSEFECSICGFETPSPLGIVSHSRRHRNRFEALVGRSPEGYEEVRAVFGDGEPDLDGVVRGQSSLSGWGDR